MQSALALCCLLATLGPAQDPFKPMNMDRAASLPNSQASFREDWVRVTNQRMEMSGKTLRVALEDGGTTAVILVKDVGKPRQAKPILQGKGEHSLLFKTVVAAGFNRIVVRNPDTGQCWGARLEQGKPILD